MNATDTRRVAALPALLALLVVLAGGADPVGAQTASQTSAFETKDGQELYRAGCAACHGPDGRGNPRSIVGFDTPLPDFSDCAFATPEPDSDWMAIVHEGGPARAFDRKMPAFGEALSEAAIKRVIDYLRGFCKRGSWPRGDLNLPRALVTEKAFPENETVLSTTMSSGDSARVGHELLYERRLGARSELEIAIPIELQKGENGTWQRGLGDVGFAVKHVLFHSLDSGTIVSAAAEARFPTGKESAGFGNGVTVVEPFVALGQILPSDGFFQMHTGVEVPIDADKASKEVFWRGAIGKSFMEGRFGRSWSPMVELLWARAVADDEKGQWDIVPQMQVTLSRRQHIMISGGVRIPMTDRGERNTQVLTYFLWDWFDGGLFEGWR